MFLVELDADNMVQGFERYKTDRELGIAVWVNLGRYISATGRDGDFQVTLARLRRVDTEL